MTPSSRFRSLPVFRQPEQGRWVFVLLAAVALADLLAAVVAGVMWRIVVDASVACLCAFTAWALHREAAKRR